MLMHSFFQQASVVPLQAEWDRLALELKALQARLVCAAMLWECLIASLIEAARREHIRHRSVASKLGAAQISIATLKQELQAAVEAAKTSSEALKSQLRNRLPGAGIDIVRHLGQQLEEERFQNLLLQAMSAVVRFEQFTVQRVLGIGQFGIVFECTVSEALLGMRSPPLAVKLMLNYGVRTTGVMKNYQRKYSVLAQLRHPNIIRLYRVLGAEPPTDAMLEFVDREIRDVFYHPNSEQARSTMGMVMQMHPRNLEQWNPKGGCTW